MLKTILVANRGEIAVRVVRACRDLGVRSVVAYSAADRDSLAVELADDAVCLGPAPAGQSYQDISAILYACARTGADGVHPGYGFLSEDPAFAATCEEVGLTFVGPSSGHIGAMGDKSLARTTAARAGVPVLPGSAAPVRGLAEATEVAARIGYPVALKAVAGAGGKGIAVVGTPGELAAAFDETTRAAGAVLADPRVYVERFLPRARHIEVQVLGDRHGTVVDLGERDCSVQRRHQKLVEECPAPALDTALRERLRTAAKACAREIGYHSAGTVEFLVGADGSAYFIEMNTRLQVEHPVTEQSTGVDLVEWMIRIASGEPLGPRQEDIRLRAHCVEARVTAEDHTSGWRSSAGRVTGLRLPAGPGIRVDTHLFDGYFVPPHYDSLLAKVIATGETREQALRRLGRALHEFRCDGVRTNVDFHRALLRTTEFQAGTHRLDIADEVLAVAGTSGEDGNR
ncbi:acetyl/propionyl/methylcrotonyl-CoA carboxylase subunit alpha [Amycolatopsis sp. YIM 10]|uniref:acetyl-CoA carboxylase biotin carboxylase subunit n=1 Tax=Amycolatopsis sp. YIM 10 TaxID=2653857 RepID=UPI00128FD44B|nr:biotin carboxylase N-terminal domain-containing protein [Amycolatopsis sp. YIM 10]QFU90541.1 Biotin carboxylase [Amycolatopsis sp. YIM 10]